MNTQTNSVILCLGSNIDKERNMECAVNILREYFLSIRFSPSYYSPSVYQEDKNTTYLNRIAIAYTEEQQEDVRKYLKQIEIQIGRSPEDKLKQKVPIDIDILKWNDKIIREKEMQRPYVVYGLNMLFPTGKD